jgi:hypothetical protein
MIGGTLIQATRTYAATVALALWVSTLMLGCSDPAEDTVQMHPTQADLMPTEEGKADSFSFNPNLIMTDAVFTDADFITVDDIQAFFEETPYGQRCFLAEHRTSGETVAEALHSAAQTYQINPLVLLVKLQVESSLVFQTQRIDRFVLDRAMGCGCPDGNSFCSRNYLGLGNQIKCAARLFRKYLDNLESNSETISGWAMNKAKMTSDNIEVVPLNFATAALYTYTPWVLPGSGGNWLFWNVMRRFSRGLLIEKRNHRWIGGPCKTEADCGYQGAICAQIDPSATEGTCTMECDDLCPDSHQAFTDSTFCAPANVLALNGLDGVCVSRCSASLTTSTCGPGLQCGLVARVNDDSGQEYSGCTMTAESPMDGATGGASHPQ